MNILINIANDYTKSPGGRYISEGPYSGEDFRKKFLNDKYDEAVRTNQNLKIILDGGFGYAPSFLEEAFGGLAREKKDKKMLEIIKIVSDEEPKLIEDVYNYILEALENGNEKNNIMKIILGIVISVVIIISIINGCKDCEKFFSFNFATGISLLFAACFSFYYVQKQADGRKQKELFIALLETFKRIIDDENNFDYSNVSKEQILMRKRDMSNKLEFIKKVGKRFSVEKDIIFLEEKFSEYNEIIGNHI